MELQSKTNAHKLISLRLRSYLKVQVVVAADGLPRRTVGITSKEFGSKKGQRSEKRTREACYSYIGGAAIFVLTP